MKPKRAKPVFLIQTDFAAGQLRYTQLLILSPSSYRHNNDHADDALTILLQTAIASPKKNVIIC